MQDGEDGKEGSYQDGTILVSGRVSRSQFTSNQRIYPMAYVRQSEAGANDVMGSKIVRADICSEDDGSKRMTSPFTFPAASQLTEYAGLDG